MGIQPVASKRFKLIDAGATAFITTSSGLSPVSTIHIPARTFSAKDCRRSATYRVGIAPGISEDAHQIEHWPAAARGTGSAARETTGRS